MLLLRTSNFPLGLFHLSCVSHLVWSRYLPLYLLKHTAYLYSLHPSPLLKIILNTFKPVVLNYRRCMLPPRDLGHFCFLANVSFSFRSFHLSCINWLFQPIVSPGDCFLPMNWANYATSSFFQFSAIFFSTYALEFPNARSLDWLV